MIETILQFLERRRRWFQAVCVVALLAGLALATRIRILDSPERWMPRSSVEAWDMLARHFDVGDMVAVGLHFHRPVTEADADLLRRLRVKLGRIQGMKQVYDASLVAEEIEDVPLTTLLDPANAQRFALYAGALWDDATEDDPSRTLMTVCELKIVPISGDAAAADELNAIRREVVEHVQRVLDDEAANPEWGNVEFHAASSAVMMVELERRARQVAFRFLPVSIAVGLASLLWGFHSWRAMAMAVAGALISTVLVLGWLGAMNGTVGVMTVCAPTLMAIFAIASTLHFASYAADHGGLGEVGRRPELIREVAMPCLGAAATTGIGFLMLGFNELAPVRDLGLQLFAGSLLAFVGVFVVSQFLPLSGLASGKIITHGRLRAWKRFVSVRPKGVLIGTVVLSVVSIFLAWPRPADHAIGIHVDADAFSFFSDDQPISKALNHFAQRKFGLYQLDVVLIPKNRGVAPLRGKRADATYQANEERVQVFSDQVAAMRDPGFVRVVSTPAFRERQAKFMTDLDRVREEEGWGRYAWKLFRVGMSAWTFGDTFSNWNHDKLDQGAVRLTFLASNQGPRGFRPLYDGVMEKLPTDRFDCFVTGNIADSLHLAEGLTEGMAWGFGSSFLLMVLLCVALFRSARLALIALAPNIVPNLAVFGLMGLFKLPISSGSAMVSTVALGINMNDTIHFLLHYRDLTRRRGWSTDRAITNTIQELGRPAVLTSVVHVAGFAIFLLTDFQPLFHFGLLASLSMLAALFGDLVLLPNLLLVFDRRPGSGKLAQEAPEDSRNADDSRVETALADERPAVPLTTVASAPGPRLE